MLSLGINDSRDRIVQVFFDETELIGNLALSMQRIMFVYSLDSIDTNIPYGVFPTPSSKPSY